MSDQQNLTQMQVISAMQVAQASELQTSAINGQTGEIGKQVTATQQLGRILQKLNLSQLTLIKSFSSLEGVVAMSFRNLGVHMAHLQNAMLNFMSGKGTVGSAQKMTTGSTFEFDKRQRGELFTARTELANMMADIVDPLSKLKNIMLKAGNNANDPNTYMAGMLGETQSLQNKKPDAATAPAPEYKERSGWQVMGDFGKNIAKKSAQKSMKAFGGVVKSMPAAAGAMGASAILMQPLMAAVGGFLEPFSIITDTFGVLGTILGTALYPILLPINDVLISMIPYLFGLVDWLYNMTENVQVASAWFSNVSQALNKTNNGLVAVISPLNTMVVLYQQIASIGTTNGLFSLDIPQVLKNIFDPTGMGAVLVDAVSGVTDELWSSIKGVFTLERDESLATYLSGAVGRLVDEIWLAIKGIFGALKTKVEDAWDDLVSL